MRTVTTAALLAFAASLAACSDQKQQTASKDQKADDGDEGSGGEDTAGGDANERPAGDAADVFSLWCEKAGETEVTDDKLKDQFSKFCPSGKPSALLSKDLLKAAYKGGSGKPEMKKLEKIEHGEKYSTAYLGLAIQLPISIQDHFDKVGPKGGDVDSLEDLAKAQGAKGEAKILKSFKEEGKYHVRGWSVWAKNEKKVVTKTVVTDTEARSDQYELEEGKAYMYTQYTTKSNEGIKQFDMLTAGVELDGKGYLITIANLEIDNQGLGKSLGSVVETQILDTAKALAKAMYQAAEKEK